MVQVRVTEPFRYVVVGAPAYLARHGTPARPEDLLRHECLTFRSQTTGALCPDPGRARCPRRHRRALAERLKDLPPWERRGLSAVRGSIIYRS